MELVIKNFSYVYILPFEWYMQTFEEDHVEDFLRE